MGVRILYRVVFLLLTFAEVMPANSPDCPKIYQRFSTSHTFCQPKSKSCDILRSNLNQQEINQVIQLHNHYRSILATQRKESNGLPPAANMLYMEWDNELAGVAQRHADQCVYAHDENDQRRVRNFAVGQNLGQTKYVGKKYVTEPEADWPNIIKSFFSEIKNFRSDDLCGSRDRQPGEGEVEHFSQLVWAESFRVGCGYTLYKENGEYTGLYVCNYGPAGNINGDCIYKEGAACSKCPVNTQCSQESEYPGLCQRVNSEPPYTPVTVPNIFNCNFNDLSSSDCMVSVTGDNTWYITPALGGNYLETVLNPGQNGTATFSKQMVPSEEAKKICILIRYRKGPAIAKNQQNNVAQLIFVIPSLNDYTQSFELPDRDKAARQSFTPYKFKLSFNYPSQIKLSFAVPNGATPQFFNVASLIAFNDKCPKVKY